MLWIRLHFWTMRLAPGRLRAAKPFFVVSCTIVSFYLAEDIRLKCMLMREISHAAALLQSLQHAFARE